MSVDCYDGVLIGLSDTGDGRFRGDPANSRAGALCPVADSGHDRQYHDGDKEKCLQVRMNDHIAKPLDVNQAVHHLATLDQGLGRHSDQSGRHQRVS